MSALTDDDAPCRALAPVLADPALSAFALPVIASERATFTIGRFNDECYQAPLITEGLTSGVTFGATTSPQTGSCGPMAADRIRP